MVVNGVIAGLPRSRVSRIGEAAPNQAAEANRHPASLSGRQIRPSHLRRPRLHRHGAAPATGLPPAGRCGPPVVPGSTGSGLQRFLQWIFEEFHKAWKTGCRAEQRQLEEADRLVPLLGALAIVAVRLLRLRDAARHDGAAPAAVPQTTIQILAAKLQQPAQASPPIGTSCAASPAWAASSPASPMGSPAG